MDIAAQICSLSAYISGLERYPESTSVLFRRLPVSESIPAVPSYTGGTDWRKLFLHLALYHAAAVHNGNIIADLCNNAKIMCNKQDGCTRLFF